MGETPRVMSTQHPDNVRQPFFCDGTVMEWEDEIKEAFYVYSHLKCNEQLWDYEGKEVDNFVIKKLLTRYEEFFRKKTLGEDLRLTVRVPNPSVEKTEGKILVETLMSIARSSDTASLFYQKDVSPVFEVAVPMCSSEKDILKVKYFYSKFISGIENNVLVDEKVKDWVGKVEPKEIQIIPLVETKDAILDSDNIIRRYLKETKEEYLRFWIARSDPALNYSSLGAVLIIKTALDKIGRAAEETSADVLPILGCGSAPFRGNFRPQDYGHILRGYPSVHTFTIQSSFKYDNDEEVVRKAVEGIESRKRGKPVPVDEKKILPVLDKIGKTYVKEIALLADMINSMAAHVPNRRMRKLHVGLFGYARSTKGIKLPRAIKFCAALYSYGLPPEILGLAELNSKDIDVVEEIYPNFRKDIGVSLQYLNKDNLKYFPKEIRENVEKEEEGVRGIVRIAGKDIRGRIILKRALTNIRGLGHTTARLASFIIEKELGYKSTMKVGELSDADVEKIDKVLYSLQDHNVPEYLLNRRNDFTTGKNQHVIMNDLAFAVTQDIDREKKMYTWKGYRHAYGKKVRGQKTRNTGRKGMALGVLRKAILAQQKGAAGAKEGGAKEAKK